MKMRRAFFAGTWYPADSQACRKQIEYFFGTAPSALPGARDSLGGIVPHAGWVFSGRIAGSVIALLSKGSKPETVVLFGGHLGPGSPHRIMAEGAWETPLGPMEVNTDLAKVLLAEFPLQQESARGAEPDNTLEVQLPLLRYAFPRARVLPLAVAPTPEGIHIGRRCGELLREKGLSAVVLGSTDLTHYGPGYGFCPMGPALRAEPWVRDVLDRAVIRQMLEMAPEEILREGLERQNACCPGAAAAAVACVLQMGAKSAQLVSYATSREIMEAEDFVGYAGIVYWS